MLATGSAGVNLLPYPTIILVMVQPNIGEIMAGILCPGGPMLAPRRRSERVTTPQAASARGGNRAEQCNTQPGARRPMFSPGGAAGLQRATRQRLPTPWSRHCSPWRLTPTSRWCRAKPGSTEHPPLLPLSPQVAWSGNGRRPRHHEKRVVHHLADAGVTYGRTCRLVI